MDCDINFSSCIKNKKEDIIQLAIKCKIYNSNKYTIEEICNLINIKNENNYKKLCLIQDV